ncbi:MAG: OmpA family protein, partial [Clostridia bacterium]|nr:OmpA family protein [Clostridia bacterium]
MKKTLAFLLAVLMLALVACSSGGKTNSDGTPNYYYIVDPDEPCELREPQTRLNAAELYSSVTYTPQMFYGHYEINGSEETRKKLALENGTMTISSWDITSCATKEVAIIPHGYRAGAATLSHVLNKLAPEYYWMEMLFIGSDEYLDSVMGAYDVVDNQLLFRPLETYSYDKETNTVEYTLGSDVLTYDFSFKGPQLTLSKDGKSLTLNTYDTLTEHSFGEHDPRLYTDCYVTSGSPVFKGMERINFLSNSKEPKYNYGFFKLTDGTNSVKFAAKLDEDGLFTFCGIDRDGNNSEIYQAIVFWCDDDGLVFYDGEKTYYYNDSMWVHYENLMKNNLTEEDQEKLESLGENAVEQLVEKRSNLFDDLAAAFEAADLNVTVDKESGEIMLDSAVLFGVDESELTDEGKAFLEQFLKVYTDVTLSDTYDGFVSKVLVEGHTDTQGDYDYNLKLSQARADAVLEWCATQNTSLNADT